MAQEKWKTNESYEGTFWKEQPLRKRATFTFHVPIGILNGKTTAIHSMLGVVKQKNDRRWEWRMLKQKNFFRTYCEKTVQGVVATKEEAMAIVEAPTKQAAVEGRPYTYGEVSDHFAQERSKDNEHS